MYQGKFANKNGAKKQSRQPAVQKPQAETMVNGEAQPLQRPVSRRPAVQYNPPAPARVHRTEDSREAVRSASPDPQYPSDSQYMASEAPAPEQRVVVKKKWKARLAGGVIFYLLLLAAVGACYLRIQNQMDGITEQLTAYEKKQPNYVSQQLFEQIFGDPDWAVIFDNAHAELSRFETKDAFVTFMEAKVGGTPLSFRKSFDSQENPISYDVLLDHEKIAAFSMENNSSDPEAPAWNLKEIQVFFEADQNYRIRCMDGHTVKVNDVEIDEKDLIQRDGKIFTEDLGDLSGDVRMPGVAVYEIENFLVQPTVTVTDEKGNAQEVTYDQESRTFSAPVAEESMPDSARNLALDAVTTYCKYMIKKTNMAALSQFFNPDTSTFRAITSSDLTWIQREKNHGTANEKVTDYVPLGENAFSIRVSLTWQLTRQDDTIKESPVDVTLLFQKDGSGNFRCSRMTGKEFVDTVSKVRVRFLQHEQVLSDVFADSTAKSITCPLPEVPEGKVLAGWVMIRKDQDGKEFYQRVLAPDAEGNAVVPDGLLKEPLVLRPVYAKQ